MSSTAISPASRWPYRPSWELDGFDFRDIKAACCRRAGSYNNLSTQHFTTGLPDRTRLSEADRSRVVANNVAVRFQAMLHCRAYFPSQAFWERVQECCLSHGARARNSRNLGELFVQARLAYLRSTNGCPNEAARLVDEWIAFLNSTSGTVMPDTQPLPKASWEMCWEEWKSMIRQGLLKDLSAPSARPNPRTGSTHGRQAITPEQFRGDPWGSRANTGAVAVIQEKVPNGDSAVIISPVEIDKRTLKRKRGLSESTQALGHDFDTPQRPSKKFPEADGKFQTEVQLPDPLLALSPSIQPKELALLELTRHKHSPEPEERESLRTPWTNKSGSRSIIASVVNNGEALPQQLNLTHSHGAELTVQEDDMALHSARIEDLEWRVGSIESKPPVSKELRDSIAELKEKMNNSNLYINSEVKKLWTDVRSTLEQEQGRLRALFDSFSADYSIDKVRTEYYQKSIEKQTRLMKKRRRAEKLHRDQLDELSSRVAELEENAKGDKESSDSEEDEYPAHVDARFAALSRRVTELENHRELNAQRTKQSIIDKLTQHILSLETQVCHLQKRSSN